MHFFNQGWLFFYKMALIFVKQKNGGIISCLASQKALELMYKGTNWDDVIKKASEFYLNPELMQELWKSFDIGKKDFTKVIDEEQIKKLFIPSP